MKPHRLTRIAAFLAAIAIAFVSASCDGSSGMGMSPTSAGPRWGGGGMSGPAVFPGGPSH